MTPQEIIEGLRRRGETVAVAESLTGGLLAAAFTATPGSSHAFRGGLVVYATDLKAALAGVPEKLLDERGPVDPDVAVALADGARERCRADWGLSTTGVAGPEPQDGKPVGTVYVAISGPAGEPEVRLLQLEGDRADIQAATIEAALELLATRLSHPREGAPPPSRSPEEPG